MSTLDMFSEDPNFYLHNEVQKTQYALDKLRKRHFGAFEELMKEFLELKEEVKMLKANFETPQRGL